MAWCCTTCRRRSIRTPRNTCRALTSRPQSGHAAARSARCSTDEIGPPVGGQIGHRDTHRLNFVNLVVAHSDDVRRREVDEFMFMGRSLRVLSGLTRPEWLRFTTASIGCAPLRSRDGTQGVLSCVEGTRGCEAGCPVHVRRTWARSTPTTSAGARSRASSRIVGAPPLRTARTCHTQSPGPQPRTRSPPGGRNRLPRADVP